MDERKIVPAARMILEKEEVDPEFEGLRLHRYCGAYLKMLGYDRPYSIRDLERPKRGDQRRLCKDAIEYAVRFAEEEDTHLFWIGRSNFITDYAFVWTIEAARLLATGDEGNADAIRLLQMAIAQIQGEGLHHDEKH